MDSTPAFILSTQYAQKYHMHNVRDGRFNSNTMFISLNH